MKKILATIFAVVLCITTLFAVTSCNGGNDATSDLKTIQERGYMVIGMECAYKPFNWTQTDDSNGAVPISNVAGFYANGYDVQIAKKVCEILGVELQIKKVEWDSLTIELEQGLIDGVIAGMSPTAERDEVIDFSDAYYNSNLVIICKKGSAIANEVNLAGLSKADYTIAAQTNTFHLTALEEQVENITVRRTQDFDTMRTDLEQGVTDGYVAEKPTALGEVAANPDLTYVDLVNNDTGFTATAADTSIAIGLRTNSSLVKALNDALTQVTEQMRKDFMDNAIAWQSASVE